VDNIYFGNANQKNESKIRIIDLQYTEDDLQDVLPAELCLQIFSNLSCIDLIYSGLVSKGWKVLADQSLKTVSRVLKLLNCMPFDELILEGMFAYGTLSGEGKITYPTDKLFNTIGLVIRMGSFVNGKLHGCGEKKTFFLESNSRALPPAKLAYEEIQKGMFVDNKLNGQGISLSIDGSFEEGFFQDGLLHGVGKKFSAASQLTREGQWNRGELEGLGKLILGNGIIISGTFGFSMLHGEANILFPSGSQVECEFQHSKIVGASILRSANGEVSEISLRFIKDLDPSL